jgi:hypothetical protein
MRELFRKNPPLAVTVLYNVILACILLPAAFLDERLVTGQPVWIKPIKFAASIALYSITFQWMLGYLNRPVFVRRVSWIIAAMGLIEMVLITAQAARGVPSHFNVDSALDGAIFSIMGISITIFWLAHTVAAVVLLRAGTSGPLASALKGGLIVASAGMMIAFFMTVPGFNGPVEISPSGQPYPTGHAIGAPQDAPGLPILGWNLTGGDLRVSHFAGLHGMQIIPLFALVLLRIGAGQRFAVWMVRAFSTAYGTVVVLFLVQALRGVPFYRVDMFAGAGLILAGVLLLLPVLFFLVFPDRRNTGDQRMEEGV